MSDDDSAQRRRNLRDLMPVIAQVLGVVLIAVGFAMLAPWAGYVLGGVGLLAAGTVAEVTHDRGER